MKKFLFLIACCMFVLTGCSGVDYSIYQLEDGSILEVFSCADDPSIFLNAGATAEQVGKFREEGLNLIAKQALLSQNQYAVKLQKLILEGKTENVDKLTNGLKAEAGIDEDGNIILRYKYRNKDCYNFFNDIKEPNETKTQVKKHFFTSDYILLNTTTKYATLVTDGDEVITLGQKIYRTFDALVLKHMGEEILNNLEKPSLNYVYLTNSSRLHSDADYSFATNNVYAHVWRLTEDTTERKITLYRTEARTGVWYSLALTAALVVVGTLWIINKKKNPLQKENRQI